MYVCVCVCVLVRVCVLCVYIVINKRNLYNCDLTCVCVHVCLSRHVASCLGLNFMPFPPPPPPHVLNQEGKACL